MAAFQKVLTKFGIVELVRTGRIALKRGEQVFESPMWEDRCAGRAGHAGAGYSVLLALSMVGSAAWGNMLLSNTLRHGCSP